MKAKQQKQQWAYEVEDRLNRMGVRKIKLADMMGLNYRQLCNVFSGYLSGTKNGERIKGLILAKLNELETPAVAQQQHEYR